jgi:hypothetical protein
MHRRIRSAVSQWCGFAFLALLGICHAQGGNAWQFVRVQERATTGSPDWETSKGTATVAIDGQKIHIDIFDTLGPREPSLIIEGTIDSNGDIVATGTRTHTDESPFDLRGHLRTWSNDFTAATDHVRRRIEYREIVFPLNPHYEFYGLITSSIRTL